jgi:hypothetical protein
MAEDQTVKKEKEEEFPVFEFISKGVKTLIEAFALLIVQGWK